MKTRMFIYTLLTVLIISVFGGCSTIKKTGALSGIAGREIITGDSNYSGYGNEETLVINYDGTEKTAGNKEYGYQENTYDNPDYTTGVNDVGNINYEGEQILIDNPESDKDVESIDTFTDKLSDDGKFINVTKDEIDPANTVAGEINNFDEDIYTNVIWVPDSRYVYSGWNPYSNGRWAWTRHGWTWVSNYRWGWATSHYGRWWYSERYGWVWSPGRRWAPAWVIRSHHKDYEGWYPISPRVHIQQQGVISTVMPHYKQNGWVIVKKEDFTNAVNNSTMISNTGKKEIIKNSAVSITLKQDGSKPYIKGPETKKSIVQQTSVDKKSTVRVTLKTKTDKNKIVTNEISGNKQIKNSVIVNKNAGIEKNTAVKETSKKVTDIISNVTVPPTLNNAVNINKSGFTEKNTEVKISPEKINNTVTPVQVNKQNNTSTVNKNSSVENKTLIKDNQKKVTETRQTYTEQNNTINNKKTVKSDDANVKVPNTTKPENSNKTVNSVPKENQSPKETKGPVNNPKEKEITKKEDK